ncbi:hypothetical protein LTR10_003224 [Elasticomyces elasticus]|uniref:DUF1446-domain-containing protein n=1 Tax=Elasticomyces elasticus TaxID=574655 RepID=A0AAN8A2D8_9PEZI|nr:hypothetical protein LTR10_003224 [Elasticomyces elasticus]KAK4969495.1 hypothetical protein LTR42_008766 [Elasticomyces elasticus]KAK5699966.1 hypothetical protein LTR97_006100 [Elasticomyces elasticus]
MGSMDNSKRPARIMSISGSPVDRRDAMAKAANSDEPIDFLVGDWMSELNMPARAYAVATEGDKAIGYEPSFLEALEPALSALAEKRIKVAANAGCVATKALFDKVVSMISEHGLSDKLKVAWVEGDVVTSTIKAADPASLVSVCTGDKLSDWPFEPVFAQCYLGGWAIAEAFEAGADIVLCGRCADASPIVAAAAYWHGWHREEFDNLGRALIAGHLIECSTYVTGGDFSGFAKQLDWSTIHDLGYPIAEIGHDGDVVITKASNSGGLVSPATCKEQLLYEIQGKYYLNCDVTAVIDGVHFSSVGTDRVRMSGISGLPPPSSTKAGITAHGGWKLGLNWALVGLDPEEKKRMYEVQLRHSLGKERLSKLSLLKLTIYGSVAENPRSQNAATVDLRLDLQAKDYDSVSPRELTAPLFNFIMQTFPAATYNSQSIQPVRFQEYFPTLIPQPTTKIHFSTSQSPIEVSVPRKTLSEKLVQPSYEPDSPAALESFGSTSLKPLGRVMHARAGDKGSNCNVGFFPVHDAAWPWLRSFLTTERFIELLADDYKGQHIDRMEFPGICAVHFLLHDYLDRGVTANATYDILGKFVAEYIRCKKVEIPDKILELGTL